MTNFLLVTLESQLNVGDEPIWSWPEYKTPPLNRLHMYSLSGTFLDVSLSAAIFIACYGATVSLLLNQFLTFFLDISYLFLFITHSIVAMVAMF